MIIAINTNLGDDLRYTIIPVINNICYSQALLRNKIRHQSSQHNEEQKMPVESNSGILHPTDPTDPTDPTAPRENRDDIKK